jgi:hypothetical protein
MATKLSQVQVSCPITILQEEDSDRALYVDGVSQGAGFLIKTPGELITSDAGYLKGHGTYVDDGCMYASVAGVVERVNKLISVRPLNSRYVGEVGDVVIGRITELRGLYLFFANLSLFGRSNFTRVHPFLVR